MTRASRGRSPLGALADELVSLDLGDAHAREAPGAEIATTPEVDDAVDLGGLTRRPALPGECLVLAGSVHQHVDNLTDMLGGALPGDRVGGLLDARGPLGGDLGADLTGERRRRRPLLGRVREDAQAVEAHLVDELQ